MKRIAGALAVGLLFTVMAVPAQSRVTRIEILRTEPFAAG